MFLPQHTTFIWCLYLLSIWITIPLFYFWCYFWCGLVMSSKLFFFLLITPKDASFSLLRHLTKIISAKKETTTQQHGKIIIVVLIIRISLTYKWFFDHGYASKYYTSNLENDGYIYHLEDPSLGKNLIISISIIHNNAKDISIIAGTALIFYLSLSIVSRCSNIFFVLEPFHLCLSYIQI